MILWIHIVYHEKRQHNIVLNGVILPLEVCVRWYIYRYTYDKCRLLRGTLSLTKVSYNIMTTGVFYGCRSIIATLGMYQIWWLCWYWLNGTS